MIAIESGYINSFDGTPIYYEKRGSGKPLIFVYGIACLMNHWHHQVEYFSQSRMVITFDLRGHHKSSDLKNSSTLNLNSLAQDIVSLCEYLKITKVDFAGHSFGGPILIELYKIKPELFNSLCLVNAFAKNPIKNMFGLDVVEPFYKYIRSQYEKSPELWSTLWRHAVDNPVSMQLAALAGGFNISLTHFKDIEVYARGVARMELGVFFQLFEELMNFDGDEVLESIDTPTLIVSGEKDGVTPKSFQTDLHEKIKSSQFFNIPYGSHCCQLDFPDYFNLRYEKFLSEIK